MNKHLMFTAMVVAVMAFCTSVYAQSQGSEEDVQIKSINLQTQVLELHNFGSQTWAMDGWRFCTHDESIQFRYTGSTGMNGLSLAPGQSLFIHWLNDSGGAADSIDVSSLGGSAIPDLRANTAGAATAIGFYRIGSWDNASAVIDHIQYSFGGMHVTGVSRRIAAAVAAELWTVETDWVATAANSARIELTADPFPGPGASHGSTSYTVFVPSEVVSADSGVVVSGTLSAGSFADLVESDNVDWSVRRNSQSINSIVTVEIKGVTSFDDPSLLEFTFESSVFARSSVNQTISLFNYDTGGFEVIDSRNASRFSDGTVVATTSGNLSRFVEPGTGCMEARIRYLGSVGRLQFTANMDFAQWYVED